MEALVLDLVEWLAARPRPYAEAIEAWRTSCPRLTVWEDAVDRGLVRLAPQAGGALLGEATPEGRAALEAAGRLSPAAPR